MINVLISITKADDDAYNLRREVVDYVPDSVDKRLMTHNDWDRAKRAYIQARDASVDYQLHSIYVGRLSEATSMPNARLLGAWDTETGLQHGLTWQLDRAGERTGVKLGTPEVPYHRTVMDFMPDEVVYGPPVPPSEDPVVISSGRPTTFKPEMINVLAGQATRIL